MSEKQRYMSKSIVGLTHLVYLCCTILTFSAMAFVTKNLNTLAYQSNDLVRAPLKLTHVEARIFALALGCLHQLEDSLAVKIHIKDVVNSTGGAAYDMVKAGCLGLSTKPIVNETGKIGKRTLVIKTLFTGLKLDEGSGELVGKFNEELKEYLLHLNGQFTIVEIETLLTLKSAHAHRLYWILKSWEKPHGTAIFDFEELRKMFLGEGSNTYTLWTDFKRYVLEPAKKELHEIGWLIEYQETKRGKKVDSISFKIPVQQQPDEPGKTKGKLTPDQLEEYRKRLRAKYEPLLKQYERMQLDFKLTESQARKIADFITSEELFHKLTKTLYNINWDIINKVKMGNIGSHSIEKLKETFPTIWPEKKPYNVKKAVAN